MRAIEIRTIEFQHQRYPAFADWHQPYSMPMKIMVARMSNPDYEFLHAVQKLIEMHLCHRAGMSEETVDDWNTKNIHEMFPGSVLGCPYQDISIAAADITGALGAALGIDPVDFIREKEAVWAKR